MADLSFSVEKLPGMDSTALVKINGAIDAKTVVLFQEKLDQLQQDGYNGFILDMEGIKYVNSTGLGTLVNVADALENKGGGIALIKIHPKVKVVFDMLGLNAFFKIFSNEKEALSHFQRLVGSSPAATKPAATSAPKPPVKETPPPPPPAEKPTPTAPKTEKPASKSSNLLSTQAQVPSGPGASFSLVCAVCGVKLTIPKPGSYRCPRCGSFFKLHKDGKAVFSERKKASPLQMKLSCTDECVMGLGEFIGVLANRIGFAPEDVQVIKDATIETCTAVIEKAYGNKQYMSYNVVITPSSTELEIQVSDYGKYIYNEESCLSYTMKSMDKFEHKQHPKGGNIITMLKRVS